MAVTSTAMTIGVGARHEANEAEEAIRGNDMALRQKSADMGMHTEQLAGRTQQRFFSPEEEERFTYPQAFEVDYNKRAEFDAASMDPRQINLKLRELMSQGYGTIVM